jgi:hypothetical protein
VTRRFAIVPSVAAEEILEAAGAEGWIVRAVASEARPDAPPQVVWTTDDGRATVTYVEDDMLDVRYVQVEGPVERVWDALRSRGMVFSAADVAELADAAVTPEEILATASYVGVAAGDTAVPDLLMALERALADPHPEVRRVALMACAYAAWPELLPRLEQIESADPDPEAKALAGRVAASVRASRELGGTP